jgi:hypothetical protein
MERTRVVAVGLVAAVVAYSAVVVAVVVRWLGAEERRRLERPGPASRW